MITKFVKNAITNLDLSKTSGPDCIPLVVLNKCEPELCVNCQICIWRNLVLLTEGFICRPRI